MYKKLTSHPLWVRGLKSKFCYHHLGHRRSHPLWVRGLKLKSNSLDDLDKLVAPFMGAWIEICYCIGVFWVRWVAPFMGAWIEIRESYKFL